MRTWIFIILAGLAAAGCVTNGGRYTEAAAEIPAQTHEECQENPETFELVCNGKVRAGEYADLYFRTAEQIVEVCVKNGDRVRKGQKIARLDLFRLENSCSQLEVRLEQVSLEMRDILIGQGYPSEDLRLVPEEIMKLAKVKSGYDEVRVQYELACRELEQATLTAPYDGIVANLNGGRYNMAQLSEPFCRILRSGSLDVEFMVMENDLSSVQKGTPVEVSTYVLGSDVYNGVVNGINPVVDENGMVRITAEVDRSDGLMDGMNVRVVIRSL